MSDIFDDNFRPEFKRYKRKSPPPCLKDVIDTDDDRQAGLLYRLNISQLANGQSSKKLKSDAARFGLKNPDEWKCYEAHGYPGFQFIRDPFLPGAQRYWVKRCLADYPCKPNVTNLDTHHPEDQLTNPWQASKIKCSSSGQTKEKTLMDQMRWVTLGYHYDWNNKVYNQDHHSPFPQDLDLMSAMIVQMLGYPAFQPQAAIVNFYHMDSTLGGHTDHSEFDLSAPLISYSLGQSAILLVGGKTKATKPLALHLRSGDIVILGGESRLAYHAVPRIMYASEAGHLPKCFDLGQDYVISPTNEDESGICSAGGGKNNERSSERIPDDTNSDLRILTDAAPDLDSQHSGKPPESVASNALNVSDVSTTQFIQSRPCADHLVPSESVVSDAVSNPVIEPGQSSNQPNPSGSATLCSGSVAETKPVGQCFNQEQLSSNSQDACNISKPSKDTTSQNVASVCDEQIQPFHTDTVSRNISSAMNDLSREDQWREFAEYLKHARINISVRQVTGPGKGFPVKKSIDEACDRSRIESSGSKRTKVDHS